jgi:uncharacterized membrane protein
MPQCVVCHSSKVNLVSAHSIDSNLSQFIETELPEVWNENVFICFKHLSELKIKYVSQLIQTGNELEPALIAEVIESYTNNELLTQLPVYNHQDLKLSERLADKIVEFGGSWAFIISFIVVLFAWMILNSILIIIKPFDPYPFIFLNLVLSCLAAIQAPLIMMSQNRKQQRDDRRAEEDYKVNLKAEIELQLLHDKMNHLVYHLIPDLLSKQQELAKEMQMMRKENQPHLQE